MISQKGTSYIDGKPVTNLGFELMKLRLKMMGKAKLAANFMKNGESNNYPKYEIDRWRSEAMQYELFATHIDEILNSCGIEVGPEYKLKRELKIGENNFGT
jgi:hypothetical protein